MKGSTMFRRTSTHSPNRETACSTVAIVSAPSILPSHSGLGTRTGGRKVGRETDLSVRPPRLSISFRSHRNLAARSSLLITRRSARRSAATSAVVIHIDSCLRSAGWPTTAAAAAAAWNSQEYSLLAAYFCEDIRSLLNSKVM